MAISVALVNGRQRLYKVETGWDEMLDVEIEKVYYCIYANSTKQRGTGSSSLAMRMKSLLTCTFLKVAGKQNSGCVLRLRKTIAEEYSDSFTVRERRDIRQVVKEHYETLTAAWDEYFK